METLRHTLRSKIFVAKKTNAKILVRKFSSNGYDLLRRENFRQNIKVINMNFEAIRQTFCQKIVKKIHLAVQKIGKINNG